MQTAKEKEYYEIVKDILNHPEFIKRKEYKHHATSNVYDHCLAVSKMSYDIAKKRKLDYKSAAIGGLLHDFYPDRWQEDTTKRKFLEKHGFTHAKAAMKNAHKYFPEQMNEKIDDIILRHMFPLNKVPPKYTEGWIVTLVDKYISLEVLKNPSFFPTLLGIYKKRR